MRTVAASIALVGLLVAAPARADSDGRAWRIAAVVSWVASGAALAVGIVAWQQKSDYEQRAHQDLALLAPSDQNAPADRAFFASPSCSPPPSIMGTAQYRSDCNSGQSWTSAATAMLALWPALAAAGTVSYLVGAHQGKRARETRRVQLLPTGVRLTF